MPFVTEELWQVYKSWFLLTSVNCIWILLSELSTDIYMEQLYSSILMITYVLYPVIRIIHFLDALGFSQPHFHIRRDISRR